VATLDLTLMDVPARRGEREAWADIAKAFSMILLVAYTLIDHRIYLNEMLIFVRMPLFFFVSGLFGYRVVTATSFRELLRDKVTNFVYLYVLWELLLYVLIKVVSLHFRGYPPLENLRMLSLLWDPLFNIWFLYALAFAFLIAWLLRTAPAWAVLAGSVAVYCASVATDVWTGLPFLERLVRLFPFFWLGLMLRPLVFRLVEQHWRLWPLVLALFLAAAYVVYPSPWTHVGPLTLATSLTGIAGFLLLARHASAFETLAAPLSYIGGSTLYIYVMHKIVIFYSELAMSFTGTHFRGEEIVQLVVTVPLCAVIGRWIAAEPALGWLFTAPWVETRPRRAEPQPMLAE
jgi:uncharacterized membrane protein YcfT